MTPENIANSGLMEFFDFFRQAIKDSSTKWNGVVVIFNTRIKQETFLRKKENTLQRVYIYSWIAQNISIE